MSELTAIVGDIHGDDDKLSSLLEAVSGRKLIFVGDYINRGRSSRQVIDRLIQLSRHSPNSVFLLGNHDAALLSYVAGILPFYKLAGMGGIATLKAYIARARYDVREEFLKAFPEAHHRFLVECRNFFETQELLVSHCGVNPSSVDSRSRENMVSITHENLFSGKFTLDKLVVCGHYTQSSLYPFIGTNLICLDTGAGKEDGKLTALLLPERTFVQR